MPKISPRTARQGRRSTRAPPNWPNGGATILPPLPWRARCATCRCRSSPLRASTCRAAARLFATAAAAMPISQMHTSKACRIVRSVTPCPPCLRYHVVLRKNIAENDDADAMYHMGQEYLEGGCGSTTGVPDPEDIKEGIDLLRKAADHGSIIACCSLAMYHKHGHYNCKVNEEKELEYMRKAAEAGCLSIHTQLAAKALAANLDDPTTNTNDLELAYHHARIGTEAGDDTAINFLKTMCNNGNMFRDFVTEDKMVELVRIGEVAKAAMESESRARADRR